MVSVTPKVNIVDPKPSLESQRRNHVIVTPEQVMVIMADLSHRENKYVTSILMLVMCSSHQTSHFSIDATKKFF